MRIARTAAAAASLPLFFALAACSSADASGSESSDSSASEWATITSAEEGGGMAALEEAAKAEGALTVIALPHNWSNYGQVIAGFKAKYPEIEVTELNPNASSKEEIEAAKTNAGTDKAPDVFDLGIGVASTSTEYFAPYTVAAWDDIPEGAKEPSGLYVGDYTGVMTIGWNADKYGDIDLDDLKTVLSDPKFAGTVALNGKPYEAGAAQNGFLAVTLNQGGSITDFQPGLDFFAALKDAGTLTTIDVTDATIDSGQTGVVFDWSYNQAAHKARLAEQQGVNWEIATIPNGEVVQYYNQAINKDAPHPAAARLWQEYLYSAEAQNEWMRGGALPVLYEALKASGELDEDAASALPETSEQFTYTPDEASALTSWLQENWDQTIGN